MGTDERSRGRRPASETREHVLKVARDLFYWEGIRSTGIDRVASMAGVAPTTLYRLFDSKDDLVASYIEREDRLYREWFTMAVESGGEHPGEKILALFDALIDQVHPDHCRGCPFQMALAEFPDTASPVRQKAIDNKVWVHEQFLVLTEELANGTPTTASNDLANSLALLVEGTYAYAQSLGVEGPIQSVRSVVRVLIAEAKLPTK